MAVDFPPCPPYHGYVHIDTKWVLGVDKVSTSSAKQDRRLGDGFWWQFDGYKIQDGMLKASGKGRPVPLEHILRAEPGDRLPPFVRFMRIQTEEDVLAFAREYGLLGVLGYMYPLMVRDRDDDGRPIGFLDRRARLWTMEDISDELAALGLDMKGRPLVEGLSAESADVQLLAFQEPLHLWFRYAKEMKMVFSLPPDLRPWLMSSVVSVDTQDEHTSSFVVLPTMEPLGLLGTRLRLYTDKGEHKAFSWKHSSLLDALWFQAMQANAQTHIASCSNCEQCFLAADPRTRYCSDTCKRQAQHRRAEERRKAQEQQDHKEE